MIDYLIEFLEGWKVATAFDQVAVLASMIALVAGVFFWLRCKIRLSVHDKDETIAKHEGQVAGYRGRHKECEAQIEVLQK